MAPLDMSDYFESFCRTTLWKACHGSLCAHACAPAMLAYVVHQLHGGMSTTLALPTKGIIAGSTFATYR
eukprot:8519620-Prorocentrum_lima.AAC.1